MQEIIDRLTEMIPRFKGYITDSINSNREIDSSTVSDYRFLAVAEYIMTKDPSIFYRHMLRASEILCELVKQGRHIRTSSFAEVYIPLAIGKADMTKEFMSYLADISLKSVTAYATYFNLCFRKVILGIEVGPIFDDMIELFNRKYRGSLIYAMCFKYIVNRDVHSFQDNFYSYMKNYKRSVAPSSDFSLEDQLIALWPLGMVNLARLSGMDVQVNHPLIPPDLIVPCQENQFIKQ